jgi:hypothetical protein
MREKQKFPVCNFKLVRNNLYRFWSSIESKQRTEVFELDEAVISCGYSAVASGAAQSFLASAKFFGLIEYDQRTYKFNFTSLAHEVLDPKNNMEAIYHSVFRPTYFKQIYDHFNNDIGIFRPALLQHTKTIDLTPQQRQILSNSFAITMEYLRDITPKDISKRLSIHSDDGEISIFYPPNCSLTALLNDVVKLIQSRITAT